MSDNLSTKYNPQEVEAGRYQEWLAKDLFKPSGDQKAKPYSIVIPPPNVTGKTTLRPCVGYNPSRYSSFAKNGCKGLIHCGYQVWITLELRHKQKSKEKLREQGISRYDLGREKFVDQVWEWKEEYAGHIREQWAKLGLSLDYSRERFTLDEGLSDAVRKVF